MSLLLDTHVVAWWFFGDRRLVPRTQQFIEQNESDTYVSAISGYEMAQKHRLGRWPEVAPLVEGFDRLIAAANFKVLNVTSLHAIRAGMIPAEHRDPFDRMLVAQAAVEGLRIVSGDSRLALLGARPIWG